MFTLTKDWPQGKKTIRTAGSSANGHLLARRGAKVQSLGLNRPVACPDSSLAVPEDRIGRFSRELDHITRFPRNDVSGGRHIS